MARCRVQVYNLKGDHSCGWVGTYTCNYRVYHREPMAAANMAEQMRQCRGPPSAVYLFREAVLYLVSSVKRGLSGIRATGDVREGGSWRL